MSQQSHALLGGALALIVVLYVLDVTRKGNPEDTSPRWWKALVTFYVCLYCLGAVGFFYLSLPIK